MGEKQLIWLGMVVGSSVGSFLPVIWGGSGLSFLSLITGALGGLAGIYLGYKISR